MAAAAELFSRRGFDGTTTREIARSAGVNEAIIFRHFTSKDELYWAVVSEQIEARSYTDGLHHLRSARSLRQALAGWAETLLHRHKDDVALTRLLLFSALRDRELSEKVFRSYMKGRLDLLSAYISEGVEQGWLRKVEPAAGARAYLAMVAGHSLIHELFFGGRHQKYDPRQVGQELADIWLNGVSARQNRTALRLKPNRSASALPGTAGNGCKAARKVAGNSEQARTHAVTA